MKSPRGFRDVWPSSAVDQPTAIRDACEVVSDGAMHLASAQANGTAGSSMGFEIEASLPFALTIIETSRVLRLDPRTVRAMVTAGDLEGNRRGHAIRVSRASVLDWLRGKRRVPRSKR
jgi:excisionase family DNA binding protein